MDDHRAHRVVWVLWWVRLSRLLLNQHHISIALVRHL